MNQRDDAAGQRLEQFLPYLGALARVHLDRRLWRRCDPDDIVQKTLCEAVEKGHQFRGEDDESLRGWLRQVLLHNVLDVVRNLHRRKCDIDLERALETSSRHVLQSLATEQSSPSERAARNEQLDSLARALARLPADQQEAVILHHLQSMSLAEVAGHLNRSLSATAGLIHRGLKNLRRFLEE